MSSENIGICFGPSVLIKSVCARKASIKPRITTSGIICILIVYLMCLHLAEKQPHKDGSLNKEIRYYLNDRLGHNETFK